MKIHKTILVLLYAMAISFAVVVVVKGMSYYDLPFEKRPRSQLHTTLKPGGRWGHGLGILGSAMMLLLFLYSARKKHRLGIRFGKIRYWLNIHIFFGIMGPVFVTLHTSFKFGGIVSISYYSMIAVMLSGFVGRYLYVQIPRSLSGDALSVKEMEERNKMIQRLLLEKYRVNPQFLHKIQTLAGVDRTRHASGFAALFLILKNDLSRPFKLRKLRKRILEQNRELPAQKMQELIGIIKQQAILTRKMALLSSIQPLFHYWHVVHKPFAYVMITIMFIHVAVTLLFGYRWIF